MEFREFVLRDSRLLSDVSRLLSAPAAGRLGYFASRVSWDRPRRVASGTLLRVKHKTPGGKHESGLSCLAKYVCWGI